MVTRPQVSTEMQQRIRDCEECAGIRLETSILGETAPGPTLGVHSGPSPSLRQSLLLNGDWWLQ